MKDMGNYGTHFLGQYQRSLLTEGYIKQELFESLFSQGILGSFMA